MKASPPRPLYLEEQETTYNQQGEFDQECNSGDSDISRKWRTLTGETERKGSEVEVDAPLRRRLKANKRPIGNNLICGVG